MYAEEDIEPEVCMTHGRFVPCRSHIPRCQYSSDPDDVYAVSLYQNWKAPNWVIPRQLIKLHRRGVVTFNEDERYRCCSMPRDDDGFCQHRPHHAIWVEV